MTLSQLVLLPGDIVEAVYLAFIYLIIHRLNEIILKIIIIIIKRKKWKKERQDVSESNF